MILDTVKIVAYTKTGYAIINKVDFDPSKHEAFKPLASSPKFTIEDAEPQLEQAPKRKPQTIKAR